MGQGLYGGISFHTNEAIKLSSGEYIAFADSDDILTPDALYEIAKAIEDEPEVDFIFTDSEDFFGDKNAGTLRCAPRFKPGWNPLALLYSNYIVHLVVIRKSVVLTVGMLDTEFDVFQDTDLLYRVTEITDCIKHIPKVLYSWRRHGGSTSVGVDKDKEDKINEMLISSRHKHLTNLGLSDIQANGYFYGKSESIVVNLSIIIAFYGGLNLLASFLDSVCFEKGGYCIEVLIINLTEDISVEMIDALKPGLLKVIGVTPEIKMANISAAYNYASGIAGGDLLAFVNYCGKFCEVNFFDWLVPFTFYPGTGLVSCAVEYQSRFNSVTYMGDKVGVGFPPEEIYVRTRRKAKASVNTDYKNETAIPDAFALVKKSVFGEAGGFDENFPRVFYMMDLSLRLNELGYRHVVCGFVRILCQPQKHPLYADGTDLFEEELELFYERHFDAINSPDRYANPNTI